MPKEPDLFSPDRIRESFNTVGMQGQRWNFFERFGKYFSYANTALTAVERQKTPQVFSA